MFPLDRFHSFIREYALFERADKILLAVSGGKDSVLMAHLFNASGFTFGIAHCNFKLRDKESDLDEDFTRNLAMQLNAPYYTISFDTKENALSDHISIQMAARNLRYEWLEKIRKDNGYNNIALAHHKNDAVETILLNLVRGTGIAGMHGIMPKRNYLIRPLLFLSGEEINKIIIKENIPYREDSSNLSVKYARNKIRIDVIPKLKELNPSLEETFEDSSRRFAELEEYFKKQVNDLRKTIFEEQPDETYVISLDPLKNLSPRQLLLFELFRPFNFNENVLDDLTLSWTGNSGKIFESSTHTLLLDRNRLILRKRQEESIEDTLIFENDTLVKWGNHTFTLQHLSASELQLTNSSDHAYIDADLLSFPLRFRAWRKGDNFYPLGMKGKKKLSDFFINKKIPLSQKKLIPILENGNGDVIWVAGYQTDNRYKITSHSKKVIIFGLQK
jgi:tRNA(Ile)-lysidine synthase